MTLTDWAPSITTTAIFGGLLWLARNLISTRLKESVQHEFNLKLETARADMRAEEERLKRDIRRKDADIEALRVTAITAMTNRKEALDKRRLEAVDELWAAVNALSPAKSISSMMAVCDFDVASKYAAQDPKVREIFQVVGCGFDPQNIPQLREISRVRPFVSPLSWALFDAYRAIAMQAVCKVEMLKRGLNAADIFNKDGLAKLVKAALPHREAHIDEYGDKGGYHHLLEVLEASLLADLKSTLEGKEADKASVLQAAEILKLSTAFAPAQSEFSSAGA